MYWSSEQIESDKAWVKDDKLKDWLFATEYSDVFSGVIELFHNLENDEVGDETESRFDIMEM